MLFTEQQLIDLNTQLASETTETLVKIKNALKGQFPNLNEAVWDRKYINDLPDAAFAAILPGGKKDKEGKIVPRSLRKLPHHTAKVSSPDDNSSVDLPHLRNALVRANQPKTDLGDKRSSAISHLTKHAKALLPSYKTKKESRDTEVEEKEIANEVKYITQEALDTVTATLQEELKAIKEMLLSKEVQQDTTEEKIDETTNTTNTTKNVVEAVVTVDNTKQFYKQLQEEFSELQKENKALIEEIEQLKTEKELLKESIHHGLAEQVVELKLELGKLLPDEREKSLEEHLAREASSLTDVFNDLKNEKVELTKKVLLPEVKDPTLGADSNTEMTITEQDSGAPEISEDVLDRARKGCKEDLETVKWFFGQFDNRSKRR